MNFRSKVRNDISIHRRTVPTLIGLLILLPCFLVSVVGAGDWSGWRGPNRNDVSTESSRWDSGAWKSLKPDWTVGVGEGATSPVVVDDRLFVMGWKDKKDFVTCLDARSGKKLWERSYAAPRYGRKARGDQGLYSGPTSTPEFDRQTGLLYTLGADGDLSCWNTRQRGKPVWSKNLYDENEIPRRPKVGRSGLRDYGFTTSPLLHGRVVIVEAGAATGTLIAFDKKTGREVWRSKVSDPPGHTGGPVLITVDGVDCVAVHDFEGLLVVRTDSGHEGETVCQIPWKTAFANNVATPAVSGNNIILTSSYDQNRIARYRISLKHGAKPVWERKLASKVCSPVIHDGHVYWAWRLVHCLDFENGKTAWEGGSLGDAGSLIATADDRLILWANRGDLRLIDTAKRSPRKYSQLTEIKHLAHADAWPHVVMAGGRLVCKDRSGTIVSFVLAAR